MHDLFGNITEKTEKLGIPYMGSKRKYADALLTKMLEIKPNAKYFYDLFGGGGAMSFAALQKGMTVFYNEKQTDLVNFMIFIFECIKNPKSEFGIFPKEYYEFITRDRFFELRLLSGEYVQFSRICYSFGNNQRTYLFNPEIEKQKHLAHDIVVFKDLESLNKFNRILNVEFILPVGESIFERRLNFYKQIRNYKKRFDLQQLERLEQLERLGRLQQLEQNITFSNLSYNEVKITTPIKDTIIYCDPPYRNTEKYIEGINHNELDEWFKNLPYTAFISEYSAPFNCVYEIETRSTFSSTSNNTARIEKLFINHFE